jgi:hypothetical protein
MRARDVPQARQRTGPVLVAVLIMTIMVLVLAAVLMNPTVLVAVAVLMTVAVAVLVIAVGAQAAHAVHDIQHARVNALPHIDKYQARVLAN